MIPESQQRFVPSPMECVGIDLAIAAKLAAHRYEDMRWASAHFDTNQTMAIEECKALLDQAELALSLAREYWRKICPTTDEIWGTVNYPRHPIETLIGTVEKMLPYGAGHDINVWDVRTDA